jgi:ubiquinone/menaquinone biosynthesis C-methylase UbiE
VKKGGREMMIQQPIGRIVGFILMVIGGAACVLGFWLVVSIVLGDSSLQRDFALGVCGVGLAMFVIGYHIALGLKITKTDFKLGPASVAFEVREYVEETHAIISTEPKHLDADVRSKREAYAKQKSPPCADEPVLGAIERNLAADLLVRPSAYPMTPMYLLDKSYRILDWNEAFSLAFDRTMEGRAGESILEWVYFLDNYEDVVDHAELFSDPKNLPAVDVEQIKYTSLRYGMISGKKRAYRIPDDSGELIAWLVTIQLHFSDARTEFKFQDDLVRYLGLNHMWSEYAMSYDLVLNNTAVYPELIDAMLGRHGDLPAIKRDSRILDLGAGTGNISFALASQGRDYQVLAVENNRTMLSLLRAKCRDFLVSRPTAPGIFPIKQDITSLYGIKDEDFDYAILNNVLYAVENYKACLDEVSRVLKTGGEIRISGPRKDTKLDVLFDRIEKDLRARGIFGDLKDRFDHVYSMNQLRLKPFLHRWTTEELKAILHDAGFSEITHASESLYAGQSMLLCARKAT